MMTGGIPILGHLHLTAPTSDVDPNIKLSNIIKYYQILSIIIRISIRTPNSRESKQQETEDLPQHGNPMSLFRARSLAISPIYSNMKLRLFSTPFLGICQDWMRVLVLFLRAWSYLSNLSYFLGKNFGDCGVPGSFEVLTVHDCESSKQGMDTEHLKPGRCA